MTISSNKYYKTIIRSGIEIVEGESLSGVFIYFCTGLTGFPTSKNNWDNRTLHCMKYEFAGQKTWAEIYQDFLQVMVDTFNTFVGFWFITLLIIIIIRHKRHWKVPTA